MKSIEAELDAQMAKVEQQAKAKAKQEYDTEKRSLQAKMDAELTELQTQLRLFQKVTPAYQSLSGPTKFQQSFGFFRWIRG